MSTVMKLDPREGGLCRNGMTLRDNRNAVVDRTKESSYYNGLKELKLKGNDPIFFEKLASRVRAVLVDARETAKKIAASPIVEQEGELCFTLYNAAGDSILTSTGIMIHVGTMGAAIKYMIENEWERNPTIQPGDMFTNNDCAIGNVHPCDVATIVPVFWEDNLVGWVGGVTHVIDLGAVSPGSMSNGQFSRFGDGLQITCRKTGVNDEPLRDWLHESQRNVRATNYWILDERTRIAGCHMIRDAVEEVIGDVGIDIFEEFGYEIIEDGRRALQNRIKTMLIPGKYRQVSFIDVPYKHEAMSTPAEYAKIDSIMHSPSTIEIRADGTWKLDFEGASRWGWHTYNSSQVAFTSGIWVFMTQHLVPNERVNDGPYYGTEFHLPYGTWMNSDDRRTGHAYAWHFLVGSWTSLWRGLGRCYFGRGYIEELNCGNSSTANWLQGGGINQDGDFHAVNSFEPAASGTGARAWADGLDHAAAIWNPEGDMGDMEIWELAEPLIYLGRAIKTNSGGYGKYRGGSGFETLRLVWKAKDWAMTFMGDGYVVCNWGMMGGYPSSAGYRFAAHNTGLKERIANGESLPFGHDWDPDNPEWENSLGPDAEVIRDHQTMATEQAFEDYDLYLNLMRGGPGFGDPIERTPENIEGDLNGNYVLPRFAETVYGAQLSKDDEGLWHVDTDATAKRRDEMKKERMAKGMPVKEWIKQEAKRVQAKDGSQQVKHMYANSFFLSDKFLQEFREFWGLGKDWFIRLGEDGTQGFGQHSVPLDSLPDVRRVNLVDESVVRPEEYADWDKK